MALDAVLARFVSASPVAVMSRLTLQRAISAEWVDATFEEHRGRQYTRELLFSTVVDLMGLVALGLRPSLHAAARQALSTGELGVSIPALYEKVNHTEPAVLRALVRGSAERLAPVVAGLRDGAETTAETTADATSQGPGSASSRLRDYRLGNYRFSYRLRIVDGNHLPASEKRVRPLRGKRSAALPGQSLVVYEPETGLVVDLVPGEDAHACERDFLEPLIRDAGEGELWIADRHFTTREVIGAFTERGARVLLREGGAYPNPSVVEGEAGERRSIGRSETGMVYEQAVEIPVPPVSPTPTSGTADKPLRLLRLRRVEVELDEPTEDGDTLIRLLTTLPATDATAVEVADLYRRRWTIEGMFQRLEKVLESEVRALGQPSAALLAFSVAVLAYNVLSVVQAAVEQEARREAERETSKTSRTSKTSPVPAEPIEPVPISMYYIAQEVRESYRGLLIAVDPKVWEHYDAQGPRSLALTLQRMAHHVRLEALRKHPRKNTPKRKPGYAPRKEVQRHISTARVIATHKSAQQKSAKRNQAKKTP